MTLEYIEQTYDEDDVIEDIESYDTLSEYLEDCLAANVLVGFLDLHVNLPCTFGYLIQYGSITSDAKTIIDRLNESGNEEYNRIDNDFLHISIDGFERTCYISWSY